MTDFLWPAALGALFSAGLGLYSLFRPKATAETVELAIKPEGRHGLTELRTTFGAYIAGPSLAALAFHSPESYAVLGGGWGLAVATRAGSILLDKASDSWNWLALGFEVVIAALLWLPWAAAAYSNV